MRAHVMSDLHLEFMTRQGDRSSDFFNQVEALKKRDPADLLILAGDICQVYPLASYFTSNLGVLCSYYRRVIYIAGNHEHYQSSLQEVDSFFENVIDKEPGCSNLIRLADGPFVHEGHRFIGDTMWFPDLDATRWEKRMLRDFSAIEHLEPTCYQRHDRFLLKVMGKLQKDDVVVTHHTPLPESIHPQYKDSEINQFFMADMTANLYEATLPKLWIHGHTHNAFDYVHTVGAAAMRVYCNPLGYPNEGENPQFWNRCGIDIT